MVMSFFNIGKSAFQTFFGLLFTIDCILNGRTNVIIMFGSFFSNLLNFPFLLLTTGLITLICIFSKISHSIFTSILILSLLRHISVDICALLYSIILYFYGLNRRVLTARPHFIANCMSLICLFLCSS